MNPSRTARFWNTVPTRALTRFFLGVFFTFAPFGFMTDMMNMGVYSPAQLVAWVLLCGIVAVGFAYSNIRNLRLLPLVIALQVGMIWLLTSAADSRAPLPHGALRVRMNVDAVGAIILLSVGYAFFVSFIVKEGIQHLRLRTEVALAEEIHQVLVPPVAADTGLYEAYGRSFPASEVGGDLVDLVVQEGTLTGYLADVSGHGVPAGTLMGMVKSAARMRLLAGGDLGSFLSDLNAVLFPLKRPNMFVTCAAVRLEDSERKRRDATEPRSTRVGGNGTVQFALAGHLPILHYRRATGTVARLAVGQLPLGILEEQVFEAEEAHLAPGDILALLSDGLTEVANAKDEEFGIGRIEAVLAEHADAPLHALFEAIIAGVRAHGPQQDDQTLLLIRALTAPPPLISIFSLP